MLPLPIHRPCLRSLTFCFSVCVLHDRNAFPRPSFPPSGFGHWMAGVVSVRACVDHPWMCGSTLPLRIRDGLNSESPCRPGNSSSRRSTETTHRRVCSRCTRQGSEWPGNGPERKLASIGGRRSFGGDFALHAFICPPAGGNLMVMGFRCYCMLCRIESNTTDFVWW